MDTAAEMIVVDRRENGPWQPFYALSAGCRNCGFLHVSQISKGDALKFDTARMDALRCPHCECAGHLFFGNADEAERFAEGKQAVHVAEVQGAFRPCASGARILND